MEVHLLRPGLADLDPTDRPRERFLREGAHALDPDELLAIVLGTEGGSLGAPAAPRELRVVTSLERTSLGKVRRPRP